ncbi:sigma-70 family RNA polymerase sigma factor [Chondromyces apiculatus]|uniref:Transcriptional control n=1 Tax=Chondromyces apiculatus DSM 436 TaxID=1192034 RepID=A0A017T8Q1_9BACT|nr:sigma-70 family RNA polymerase sigma factor [Chondromyces apiculatus]EYF05352.1 transcriptional control [Chondromyces apiculatus DSM 436]
MEDLLERARAGDAAALAALFRRARPKLDKLAAQHRASLRPGITRPSDIAQSTAERAFEKFTSFNGKTENEWTAWLRMILTNCVKESQRAGRTQKRSDRGATPLDTVVDEVCALQDSPSQVVARKEQYRLLLTFLHRLPPDQGEAILLCHLHDLRVSEVAQKMNRTQPVVGGLLSRGMRTLRKMMNEGLEADPDGALPEATSPDGATTALLEYLRRRESRGPVDPEAFLAEHPAHADDLRSMLDWIAHVQTLWASADDR